MALFKQIVRILIYGTILALIPASVNYIYVEFGVPRELSVPFYITVLLVVTLMVKWQDLPARNIKAITLYLGSIFAYSVLVATDTYLFNVFEPNMFWLAGFHLPLILYIYFAGKEDTKE